MAMDDETCLDEGSSHGCHLPLQLQFDDEPHRSTSSSVTVDPPYRRGRFEHLTRRQLMERRKWQGRSPCTSSTSKRVSQHNDHEEEEKKSDSSSMVHLAHETFLGVSGQQDNDRLSTIRHAQHDGHDPAALALSEQPINETEDGPVYYYRVVYRGVVAMLSMPDRASSRSGCYASYGEILASRFRIPVQGEADQVVAIRVDEILTGGYAFDPLEKLNSYQCVEGNSETPKKSNVQGGYTTNVSSNNAITSPTPSEPFIDGELSAFSHHHRPMPGLDTKRCEHEGVVHHGFVFSHNKRMEEIMQCLPHPPQCQHGRFFYKIVSTTPLPILLGPSMDAPLSKAMVLPGTIHEVSFRLTVAQDQHIDDNVSFLRLGRRKGYIASRRSGRRNFRENLVKDVTDEINASSIVSNINSHDGGGPVCATATSESLQSFLSTSIPASVSRSRHRPPRRRRDSTANEHLQPLGGVTARKRINNLNSHQHNDTTLTTLTVQSLGSDRLQTPSSNVSLLSDDSFSLDHKDHQAQYVSFASHDITHNNARLNETLSPDRSVARSIKSNNSHQSQTQQSQQQQSTFFLMRVTAPRGLRILDAPHFQVNNLIHGTNPTTAAADVLAVSGLSNARHNMFQTMAGRITTTNGISSGENAIVFDSVTKTRILPCGSVFEASRKMEPSETLFHQGVGLIKLADNSGWVIVPHPEELELQFRNIHGGVFTRDETNGQGYEEIGNAIVFHEPTNPDQDHSLTGHHRRVDFHSSKIRSDVWMRVVARGGAHVACAPLNPPLHNDAHEQCSSSTSSSPASSAISGKTQQEVIGKSDSASDVASSVGSSFLDAMFRNPKRNVSSEHPDSKTEKKESTQPDKAVLPSTTIPCGMCVKVEPQIPSDNRRNIPQEYARLRGGQGWLPLFVAGKPACLVCPRQKPPESRRGSFWFRVQAQRGMKVRVGPSTRAPSIKSADGAYFRFECGEFLRASEILTVYHEDSHGRILSESFAKLYRNRHVRQHPTGEDADFRQLASFTTQAEWVQIHDDEKNEEYLQECAEAPRIERHRQGWRYKVVASTGVAIRKGPSHFAQATDQYVEEGKSIAIIERVTSVEDSGITWLRMKDGQGWLHDLGTENGETLIIPHTLRHRTKPSSSNRPIKPRRPGHDEIGHKKQQIAYNTIIARLFHNDLPSDNPAGGTGKNDAVIQRY